MEEYCPRCRKLGINTKIEQMQINQTDSIRICPLVEKCPWPFGYEKIKLIPRDWTTLEGRKRKLKRIREDENKKKKIKTNEIELNLYTPPVTPNADGSLKIDNMTPINSSKYISSIISSDKKKLKKLESRQKKSSIFDIDGSEFVAKLNESGVVNASSNNCDNTSSKSLELVGKKNSNKSGRCDIIIKEVKKSKIDIQRSVVDSTGKKKILLKQKKLKKQLENVSTDKKAASTIENQQINSVIDSMPKISDDLSSKQHNESHANKEILAENICDMSDLDKIIQNNFNEDDISTTIQDLSSITSGQSTDTCTAGNFDNCAIDGVAFPESNNLTFDDSLLSSEFQDNSVDWLSSWLM